jgi:hypothetical protein
VREPHLLNRAPIQVTELDENTERRGVAVHYVRRLSITAAISIPAAGGVAHFLRGPIEPPSAPESSPSRDGFRFSSFFEPVSSEGDAAASVSPSGAPHPPIPSPSHV